MVNPEPQTQGVRQLPADDPRGDRDALAAADALPQRQQPPGGEWRVESEELRSGE